MKRKHIVNPPDFVSIEGKLRAVEDSLDGLLDSTEQFKRDGGLPHSLIELIASMTASLIVLHQVVAEMLREEGQT